MGHGSSQKPMAFVLAGGGSFGAIQVGMLQALVEAGVKADMVVGASVGAYNAAVYAADPTVDGMRRLAQLWRGLKRSDVFPVTLSSLWCFLVRQDVLIKPRGLRSLVERNLPYRNLEDAPLPVHIVSTDYRSGAPVVLSTGSAADAILASSAIPAVFPPVNVDGRYLVDGAIASNTPVRTAVNLGARRVVVLPTGFACGLEAPPKGSIAAALHALTLLIARQLVSEIESIGPSIDVSIVPTLCPLVGSPYDFTHSDRLIEDAARATADWIASDGLASPEIPDQLRLHDHGVAEHGRS